MTQADALAALGRMVDAAGDPPLSPDDLAGCLADAARFVGSPYPGAMQSVAVGFVTAVPVLPSGLTRLFRCLTAGTLGGVLAVPNVSSWLGYRLGDGTAVWVDVGIAPPDTFDVRAAARAAWLLKASRAAQYFDVKSPGQVFDQSQVYRHCTEMADRFRPVFVA